MKTVGNSRIKTRFTMLLLGMMLIAGVGLAADSCSDWLWQKDGLYWRQCVRDNGTRYCQEADDAKGTNVRTVPCT
jgi:hypothetical protein